MATEAEGFADQPMPGMPEPQRARLYVAGPMRGFPAFNFPAFTDAAKRLRAAGHEVFSPAERDREIGFDPHGMSGSDEDMAAAGFDLRAALGADLAWITGSADAVIVLPGWERSARAQAEVATARALGLPVQPLDAFLSGEPAGDSLAEASEALLPSPGDPPLPDGQFGRVELPGYRQHTGWVTDGTRGGAGCMVIRDWDGHVLAEVFPGGGSQFVHLPTPLKRPEAEPQRALNAGRSGLYVDDREDEWDERNPF